jgi:hypothetical protein
MANSTSHCFRVACLARLLNCTANVGRVRFGRESDQEVTVVGVDCYDKMIYGLRGTAVCTQQGNTCEAHNPSKHHPPTRVNRGHCMQGS